MRTRPTIVLNTVPPPPPEPLVVLKYTKELGDIYQKHAHNHYQVHNSLSAMTTMAFVEEQKALVLPSLPPYYPGNFNRQFFNAQLVTGSTFEPIVVRVECALKGFVKNQNSGKEEVELWVNDSNFVLAITELIENIRAYFNGKQDANSMSVSIKHPIYKEVLTAGWYQEYGKYKKIGLQKSGGQLVEIGVEDIPEFSKVVYDGSACKARLLLTTWARVDSDKNTVFIGLKPYLQSIEFAE